MFTMVVSRWILWHSSHQEMGCILSPFIESNVPVTALTNRVVTQSLSHAQLLATLWPVALQALLSFTIPWVCSNSCPLSWWCYLTTSSSATHFSFCLQFFPAAGSFPMSQLFASGGQRISASASVLPMNIQDWFPLGLTSLISLQSKGLSRVFFSTTIQKHQFFDVHICTWLLEKP